MLWLHDTRRRAKERGKEGMDLDYVFLSAQRQAELLAAAKDRTLES